MFFATKTLKMFVVLLCIFLLLLVDEIEIKREIVKRNPKNVGLKVSVMDFLFYISARAIHSKLEMKFRNDFDGEDLSDTFFEAKKLFYIFRYFRKNKKII